ncbi:MAG: ribonuclease P protein component [Selenomonadaceae bacterium]|nr:ribonuclease P protein component [Selenomonadaceae bacterium]MBQ7629488.1 ribonuclease P protein component [Selenomonadaceae bacterium]
MYELNKNEILRDNRDFNAVYTKGRSYVNKNLVLHVLNDERYNGKVGFAAGKKLGCAVVRNRVKRLLRETYRLCKKNLRRDRAIILMGRKNLVDAKLDTVMKSFRELIKKAKLEVADD